MSKTSRSRTEAVAEGKGGTGGIRSSLSFGLKKLRAAEEAAFRKLENFDLKEVSDCAEAEVEDEIEEEAEVVLVIVEDEREVDSELRLEVEKERRVGLRVKSSQESVGLAEGE